VLAEHLAAAEEEAEAEHGDVGEVAEAHVAEEVEGGEYDVDGDGRGAPSFVLEVGGAEEGAEGFALGNGVGDVEAGQGEGESGEKVAAAAGGVVEAVAEDGEKVAKEEGAGVENGVNGAEESAESAPQEEALAVALPRGEAQGEER
jgi:hypothetical protein